MAILLLLLFIAISAGSVGIIECLGHIHKCEKDILKELRHRRKSDNKDD